MCLCHDVIMCVNTLPLVVMSYVLILYLTIHLFLHAYFQIATLSVEKDSVAVAPFRMEEDENGDPANDDTAEPIRKMTSSPEKKSDAEISKWEDEVCLHTFGVCLYVYILLDDNICLIIFSFYCILSD